MRSLTTCALLTCVVTLSYAAVLSRSGGESACPAGARCAPLSACPAVALDAAADVCTGPFGRELHLCCWEAPSLAALSDLTVPLRRRRRSPQPPPAAGASPAARPSAPPSTAPPAAPAGTTPAPRPGVSSVTTPTPRPTASSAAKPTSRPTVIKTTPSPMVTKPPTTKPTSAPAVSETTPSGNAKPQKVSPSQKACEEFRRFNDFGRSTLRLDRRKRELQQLHVVGGERVISAEFNYMVAIGYVRSNSNSNTSDLQWGCGGSLISDRYVLTAAHCITDAQKQNMRAAALRIGVKHLQGGPQTPGDFSVAKTTLHPRHRPELKYFDLALLRTDRPVGFSSNVLPVCLATPETRLDSTTTLVVAGWGAVDTSGFEPSADLKKAQLRLVDLDECKKLIEISSSLPRGVEKDMICAAEPNREADTCLGDSGGPLAIRRQEGDVLVGVTSFGGRPCASSKPGVYAGVLPELPWIESIVWS